MCVSEVGRCGGVWSGLGACLVAGLVSGALGGDWSGEL